MNPDYSSDIRQVQRFIFEHNLYLLTMFEKKIISFSSSNIWQNKDIRKQYKQSKMHATNIIDCDNFLTDAVKKLSQDLTKPIWNCITKIDPRVVYREQSSSQPLQMINAMGKIFHTFFSRLKNEHQDESNLRINITSYELDRQVVSYQQQAKQNVHSSLNIQALAETTYALFQLLLEVTEKEEARLQEQAMEDDGTHSHKQLKSMLNAASYLLNMYLSKIEENFNNQLDVFNKIVVSNFNDIINCKIASVVLCLQPKLLTLPLLIHPMLISIHSLIRTQAQDLQRRQQQKALRNSMDLLSSQNMNLNQSHNLSASSALHLKQMRDQKQSLSSNCIFRQISKSQNISKIVFINLDGYQSQFNIDIAKYLCKNIMYVSFPKQSANKFNNKDKDKVDDQMNNMQDFKSQRLLRKYYHGRLTAEQKYKLLQNFKLSQKQHKKNLYVFPLHSRSLSSTQSLPCIHKFQSAFILFIMRELIFAQILDFNPSVIVISYSQKIDIQKQSFVELMKQLTVLGNYKIVFYANTCKNYMFEEYYSQEKHFKVMQQKYYQEFQSEMRMFKPSANKNAVLDENVSVNCDLFQKMAIMLKVCSGTHNLNRATETDSFIEKYKNYKVLTYAGPLIHRLSDQFPNLSKLKMRLMDYTTLCRVLESYFNNKMDVVNKLFKRSISAFYTGLFRQIDKIIIGTNQQNKTMKPMGLTQNTQAMINIDLQLNQQDKQRKKQVEQQITQLIAIMLKKLSPTERQQSWKNFKFQRSLQISTEKLETKFFAHLPKKRANGQKKNQMPKKQTQNLICLEFYISSQRQKLPVELSPSTSKVYYCPIRRHPIALFYITNHLIKTSSTAFTTLYGKVTQQFDYKVSPKVQLRPVTFNNGPYLDQFETFTEFNYYESNNYIFMFWPKIYNAKKQLISRFIGEKYTPEVTQFVFCAKRAIPDNFKMIYKGVQNDYIIPRHGCQCYEIEQTNTIYIFGGFYSDQRNYLQFQTDITKLVYTEPQSMDGQQFPTVSMESVPKQFYFDFQQLENNKEIKVITNLRNHMVRPKVQYQFLESDEPQVQNDHRVVYLLGGVGQNFIRAYSMIGFMAHRLTFNVQTGNLVSIKRISMNNIIPVNTHQPIKLRMSMQAKILTHAQNRSINYVVGDSGLSNKGFTVYHNNVRYNHQNQRFEYDTEYEVLDTDYRCYREQVDFLKKSVIDNRPKLTISAKNTRGKQYNTNYLLATLQSNQKFILQLQLQLPLDIKSTHPDLPSVVHLTGQSIISIDVNNTAIYALIRHPIYTLDQCLLVYYDLYQQQRKFKEKKCVQVQLKQLYRFDQDVSMNVIVVAKFDTIVILHGQKFQKNVHVTELVLKISRKKHIKIQIIQSNSQFASTPGSSLFNANKPQINSTVTMNSNNWHEQFYRDCQVPIINGLSCSIFLNQNNGTILCFSFKSVSVQSQNDTQEAVYVIIQKLDLNCEKYGWQIVVSRKYQIIVASDQGIKKYRRRDKLKLAQIVQHKRQVKHVASSTSPIKTDNSDTFVWIVPPPLRNCTFELIAIYKQECVSAKLELDPNLNVLEFASTGTSEREYFKQIQGTVSNSTNLNMANSINMVNNNVRQSSNVLEKRLQDYINLANKSKQEQEQAVIRKKWNEKNTSKVMNMRENTFME